MTAADHEEQFEDLTEEQFEDLTDERGFAVHIIIGTIIAIPIFVVGISLLVMTTTSGMELSDNANIAGIAVWASVWAGLFLGGGMGVTLWLMGREKKGLH